MRPRGLRASTPDFAVGSTTSETRTTRRLASCPLSQSVSRRGFVLASGGSEMGGDPTEKKPSPAGAQKAVLACPAPASEGTAADAASAAGGGGGAGVVMVKRAALVACLTCPLCGRLLRDPATITECLHTFCRKCISEEFIDKEICFCPTCNIDLGCAPEEKLRADHSLLYVRSKIFAFKRRKVEVEDQEVISPIASPVKRKERSLSSLTVHGPRVSIQKCLTKRRTKAPCLRSLSLGSKDTTKKVGGWKPLSSHVRVGKDRKSLKLGSEDDNISGIKSGDPDDGAPSSQAKARKHLARYGNLTKKAGSKKVFALKGKKKRFKAKQPRQKRRFRALWFYLVAAFDQKGQSPLPQLPTKFLRIKDVDLPASFIQKYLVQRLNLSSEAEVELMCGGKTVDPAITLHDLADSWLDKGAKGRVRSFEGAPATGFITTLFYSRPEPRQPTPLPPPGSHSG